MASMILSHVLVSLEYSTGWLCFTPPTVVLASMILSTLPGLIDLKKAQDIWRVDKIDFLGCAGAFFVVLIASVEVTISFAKIFILISIQPGIAIVGRLPGTDAFCDAEQYPVAVKIPGVLVVRVKSAWLCCANANLGRERIVRWVIDEDAENPKGETTFKLVIIDTTSMCG